LLISVYFAGILWYLFTKEFNNEEETGGYQLLDSFYYASSTLTTVGLGDIHACSSIDRIAGTFLLLYAVCHAAFFISAVSATIS